MSSTPQFGTAEYRSDQQICAGCKNPLSGNYYRINGVLACDSCTQQIKMRRPQDSRSTFGRALLFGIGGAIVGLILYSTFTIVTGIIIGYVSLAVGWLVGTAMKKGSAGVGGRRYQIAAVALTYSAVSLSAIPIGLAYYVQHEKPAAHVSAGPSSQQDSPDSASSEQATTGSQQLSSPPSKSRPAAGATIVSLLFAGLASPFLELSSGFSGIIGLVILFVGIRIAWKITSAPPLEILGPFQAGEPTATPMPSGA